MPGQDLRACPFAQHEQGSSQVQRDGNYFDGRDI